jgi:hypothetical protein
MREKESLFIYDAKIKTIDKFLWTESTKVNFVDKIDAIEQ